MQCKICTEIFPSKTAQYEHSDSAHFSLGRCTICDKQLIFINGQCYILQLHNDASCNKETVAKIQNNYVDKCDIDVATLTSNEKTIGRNVHDIAQNFPENKPQSNRSNNSSHNVNASTMLTDEDLRRLPPSQISAKSTGEKHLRRYQCDICERYLLSKRTITAHMKLHQTALSDLACDICGRILKNKNSLKTHKAVHLDTRQYICNYCGKGFRSKNSMIEHTNTHTGLRPHRCSQCNKAFGNLVLIYQIHLLIRSFTDNLGIHF